MNKEILNRKSLLNLKFAKIGKNIEISKNVTIIGAENISLSSNIRIDDYTIISCLHGKLSIGSNVHIGGQSYIGCSGGVKIGDNINISQGVKIYSKINNYTNKKDKKPIHYGKVIIGDDVIIGSNSVIVGKCELGKGSTVGALSLVNKDLENWGVFAGIPVKKVRKRKND